jgi:hypothetical protein
MKCDPDSLTGDDLLDRFLILNTDINKCLLAYSFVKKNRIISLSNLFQLEHTKLSIHNHDVINLLKLCIKNNNLQIAKLILGKFTFVTNKFKYNALTCIIQKLLKANLKRQDMRSFLHQVCSWAKTETYNMVVIPMHLLFNVIAHRKCRAFVKVLYKFGMIDNLLHIDVCEYNNYRFMHIIMSKKMYVVFRDILNNNRFIPQWFILKCLETDDVMIRRIIGECYKPRTYTIRFVKQIVRCFKDDFPFKHINQRKLYNVTKKFETHHL